MREEQKQKQENQTKQKLYHKTNGTAAVNRAVSQAWGLEPRQGECPGCVPSPLTTGHWTLEASGPLTTIWNLSSPPLSFHTSPFVFLSLQLLISVLLALMSLGFCFIQKYLLERFPPPFAVLSVPFFQHLYCFLLMFLLLLSWHFC